MVKSKIVMGVDPQDLVNQINAMLNGGTGFVGDTESVDAGHTHIPEKYACSADWCEATDLFLYTDIG